MDAVNHKDARGLGLVCMWIAFLAFLAASFMGLYQVAARSGLFPELQSPANYFASVSTHGVLMAYVLTTFLVMGFGYYAATSSLKRSLWNAPLAWAGVLVTIGGTLMAAYPLLTRQASVLYTFYPPLQAHPAFYIGATVLVAGSWVWCLQMIMMMVGWKKDNPGRPVPLVMFGTVANAILWLWTSAGVAAEMVFQLIPWSLGLKETVDVGLARTLFAWTLHPIVYFWLFPAYIAMYTLLPRIAGGRLFSDEMGRIAFIMLLVISLPIGFHHLYMDPFQAGGWKFLHAIGTFAVVLPTLITGFTIIASLEIAGRLRGGRGLLGWIAALPWKEPMVVAAGLALLMLTLGGFGGVVNASYAMNAMVHNTQWVTGHFHLIFAGTTVIMYFAIGYHLWPYMTGRDLFSSALARFQLWLWFIGIVVLTLPWHVIGLIGQPRRISSSNYDSPLVEQWRIHEVIMIAGGVILVVSAILLAVNLALSHLTSKRERGEIQYAEPLHPVFKVPPLLNGFALWNWILVVWMIAAFGYPILQFFLMDTYGTVPWSI